MSVFNKIVLLISMLVLPVSSYVLADTMRKPSVFTINGGTLSIYENAKRKLIKQLKLEKIKVEEAGNDVTIPKNAPLLVEVKRLYEKITSTHTKGRVWLESDDKKMSIQFDVDERLIVDIFLS